NPDPLANPVGGGDTGKMFRRARIETRARDMLLTRKRCGLDLKHQIDGLGETIIEEDGDLELHREITHGGSFGGAPQANMAGHTQMQGCAKRLKAIWGRPRAQRRPLQRFSMTASRTIPFIVATIFMDAV